MGPGRGRPPMGPGGPPPPGWGPPHPDWGPPHPSWGPPRDWPPPPGGWGPRGPPPPDYWGPHGPPPPDWNPRGPPGWDPYPDDFPPRDWGPEDWRLEEEWRRYHEECRAREGWDPHGPPPPPPPPWDRPPGPWVPEPMPPPDLAPPDLAPPDLAPPDLAPPGILPMGPPPRGVPPPGLPPPGVPPPGVPPPGIPPPGVPPPGVPPPAVPPPDVPPAFGYPGFMPPPWSGEHPRSDDTMLNDPTEKPAWIKALISAPPGSSVPETKAMKALEDLAVPPPPGLEVPPKVPRKSKKTKTKKVFKPMGLLGKRPIEKPLPGRSTGVICFIGPTFGHIEREDKEKFTFTLNSFFGNPKSMIPGVRVHFTAVHEDNSQIATDIKVPPSGTENVDSEILEAVVSQPIVEPAPGERQYPGQVYVTLGQIRTNVSFEKKDSNVTLLKDDQILMNLLTDIVTNKRRATNIRPKIPDTFTYTGETRETGVIVSFKGTNEGLIKCDAHGEILFDIKENFSEVDFSEEDINEEVEFTVITLRAGKRAIRIRRVKEPLLLTLCSVTSEKQEAEEEEDEDDDDEEEEEERPFAVDPSNNNKPLQMTKDIPLSNFELDPELYEGIVSQPIIEPSATLPGYPGQIHANIGPVKTNVTFDHRDCGVTLLKNDHVLINLLIDKKTLKKRAANIKPKIPFTFNYTKEKRELGIITKLGPMEGIINAEEHGEIPFDKKENFSDTELNKNDIHKEVEFTMAQVKMKKRAVRLRRTKRIEDKILAEQKKRREEEEEERRQEMERRKRELERKRQEEEERRLEAEKKKKEEVAAALAAARDKWTPLGFMTRGTDPDEDLSKDRFNGTVLKAINKHPTKEIKKESEDPETEPPTNGTSLMSEVKVKLEKEEESEEPAAKEEQKDEEEQRDENKEQKEIKEETKEEKKDDELKADSGLLVMTVDGEQKKLGFRRKDLLTQATMLFGDKVRFNIATHRETKKERATYVEILGESFEESIEERQHGIVIEFSHSFGLIKCSQNPQLYFHMSEVIEKKRLELNEKVEFTIAPRDTAEGEHQAIRIKRFTESMFLPGRKLSGVNTNKGKMTIKLSKPSQEDKKKSETDKMKAVVKNLRAQDSKSRKGSRHTRSRSRSKSKSPERDQFGRVKKRRSSSPEHRRSRSRDPSRKHSRSRDRSRKRSRSSSSSRSRSRSRERSREHSKWSKHSRDKEEYSRRREYSPRPPRRVDDELARKKRELEELNEMIAYKKALVDPRAVEPGLKTCIDYGHGRIGVPIKEFTPLRPVLNSRDDPEYSLPKPYRDPYYDRDFDAYRERCYADPYSDRYGDPYYARRPYGNEGRPYPESPYGEPSTIRYTDRYDVYDQPYESRFYDRKYSPERAYPDDPYRKPSPGQDPPPQQNPGPSGPPFRPPSPEEPPPRSPSPKRESPPSEKPPLDRFLDMLNKKKSAPLKLKSPLKDDLLPHERALQEGTSGFSRIVGLPQEQPSSSILPLQTTKPPSPKPVEEAPKPEPYDKIQSLLRTIGLKLTTDDVSKLRAQAGIYTPKSSSLERDVQREDQCTSRTNSVDRIHSPSPARSASLEPLARKPVNEYESFLDQQEIEALKKAQQMQSLTRVSISGGTPPPKPPPGPPPAQYQRPPVPDSWDILTPSVQFNTNDDPSLPYSASKTPPGPPHGPPPRHTAPQTPPGPPPGPPPRRPPGPVTFMPTQQSLPFLGKTTAQNESSTTQASSQSVTPTNSAISTTVARCLQVIETVRSLAVQPPAKLVKSVQFNLPTESSSQPLNSEEDIKNMQQEKLDLYNQRIMEKREQEKKKMEEARKSQDKNKDGSVVPAKLLSVEQKNVWVCGHSLIYWAESRAKSPEVGMQLGMDPSRVTLWWKGTQGMTWSQLLPQLHQLKVLWPNPDVLIIHLGGNDLNDSPTDLLGAVRRDLTSIRSIFPRCLLVWSHILPRRVWRHSSDSHEVDLVRTTVNRRIHGVLAELGGVSLMHDNIRCGANTGLYRADGVHLSPKGIDVFNLNLQDLLEKWDQQVNKTQ